ncbi:carboxy methyl transferase for protein phosphatase 2A [Rhodotorula kratochvilovae]
MLSRAAPPDSSHSAGDAAVRSTDSDALVSRASAAALGYLDDPFARLFLGPAQRRSSDRRPPLINIGTHARTWAVDHLVDSFLRDQVGPTQVLSLGAGTDTRFWRTRKRWEAEGREWTCARWVEVDFPEATGAKARTVSSKPELKGALGGTVKIEQGGLGLSSPLYALVPGDIRSLSSLTTSLIFSASASPAPLSPAIPTLLLLECVAIYLPPSDTAALLSWFAQTWGGDGGSGGAVVMYDPFGLDDAFGAVMKRNLAARALALPGAAATLTLASLAERLRTSGARGDVGARSVREIRERCWSREERERVARIEQIDEVEELNLVLEHYAVSWANLCPVVGDGRGIGLVDAEA